MSKTVSDLVRNGLLGMMLCLLLGGCLSSFTNIPPTIEFSHDLHHRYGCGPGFSWPWRFFLDARWFGRREILIPPVSPSANKP